MMATFALSLAYAGLTGLCLSMQRHYRQVFRRDVTGTARTAFLLFGWTCLALSTYPCFIVWGAATGTVAWFGVASAAGFMLAFTMPYAPVAIPILAAAAPLLVSAAALTERW